MKLVARTIRPLALACALLSPGVAFAQAAPVASQKPLDRALQGPAREAYTYAKMLFDHGDFEGALAKYEQAYDLSKEARLLYNMAICERNLRAYARMQVLLQRYESESGAALSAEDRATVDAALAAIRSLVGKVTLRVDPPGASVTVDGEAVGSAPLAGPIVLDLGKHTVVVKSEGFETAEQSIAIAGGAESAVDIKLVAPRVAMGHLVVAVDDAATIVVDGFTPARGRFDASLAPGVHDVSITESGKLPYRAPVDLGAGETRSLQVTLENERHGRPIWPWIVGGAVIAAAGAAVGGYFLFRSQESAPPLAGDYATVKFSAFEGR